MKEVEKQTYKDTYHFNRDFYGTNTAMSPSINVDPKINSTIKQNNERSNVEIEKDEVVLQPDLSALFKARGKSHANGGIKVSLRPNAFVFSDDPTLHFTEDEQKLFEFKKGGKFKKTTSTPADVLKRNVDVEHYNKLVSNLADPKKDDLAKRSSSLMLQKYLQTLGNIGFLQEQKKNFPDGVPFFSEGTAPLYDGELKEEIMEQKQYARFGGKILPKAQKGLNNTDKELERLRRLASQEALNNPESTVANDAYMEYLQSISRNALNGVDEPQGKFSGVPSLDFSGVPDNNSPVTSPTRQNVPLIKTEMGLPQLRVPAMNVPKTGPQESTLPQDKGYSADWQFTPFQKESQGYNLLKLASAKRYMPYRSRYQATYVDPALVNPEQTIGDVQSANNQQISAINTLNPILRNAQASSAFAQYIDKIPGIRSQYDNQNAQIQNQTRGINTQIRNQETQTNMQNDQQYYQQSVVGQQNFDNLRTFMGDQYMNNRMQDVQDNQSLAYTLLQQENPAYNFDFKTGQFKPNPNRSILNLRGNNSSDALQEYVAQLKNSNISEEKKQELLAKVYTGKYLGTLAGNRKKGGLIK